MILNATRLSELAYKREGNCNVMKSHDQSRDESNQIETISYHNLSRVRSLINHPLLDLSNQINLLIQPFDSTFQINLSNQSFESTFSTNLD